MVSAADIEDLADHLSQKFGPDRIGLFGSYASGQPTEDSDVDLLVVMRHRGPGYRTASRLRLATEVPFPMDIIVCSPARLRKRLAMGDQFLTDIIEHGLVLHDGDDRGVGEEGRRRLRRRLHTQTLTKRQPIRCHLLPLPAMR